jgi:large subunit ribosomal protein L9
MEVILLERIAKLGQMGDVVRVKDGFARNYLLPKGKALRASETNRSRFETMKIDLEARNLQQRGEAEKVAERLNGQSFTVLRQAAEGGQLYGSVSPRDIVVLITERGFTVERSQIVLHMPIKMIGVYKVPVSLHPEVEVTVSLTVARSADEAERLKRGEDVTVARGRTAGGGGRRGRSLFRAGGDRGAPFAGGRIGRRIRRECQTGGLKYFQEKPASGSIGGGIRFPSENATTRKC